MFSHQFLVLSFTNISKCFLEWQKSSQNKFQSMVQAQDLGPVWSVGNRVQKVAPCQQPWSWDSAPKGKLPGSQQSLSQLCLRPSTTPLFTLASSLPPASHSSYNLKITDNKGNYTDHLVGTYYVPWHWARHFQSYLIAQLLEVDISTPISTHEGKAQRSSVTRQEDHSQDSLVPKFMCSALGCLYRTLRTLKFVEASGRLFKDTVWKKKKKIQSSCPGPGAIWLQS